MRVCMITSVHQATDGRIFHKEARTLAEAGFAVTVIAPGARDDEWNGVQILGVPSPRSRLVRMTKTCMQLFRRARAQRADVYHFHDPELVPWAVILRLLTRATVVYDIHERRSDTTRREWIPPLLRGPISVAFNFTDRLLTHAVNHLVLAAPVCLEGYEWHPSKTLVRNYPLMAAWTAQEAPYESRWLAKTAIYAGAIARDRCALEMVEAMHLVRRELADAKLVIVGIANEPDLLDEMRMAIRERNLEHAVQVLPPIPHDELPSLVANCSATLAVVKPTPENMTATPTKLFEGMAAGLPVVYSGFPYWRSVLSGVDCGVATPDSSARSIADGLVAIWSDCNRAAGWGQVGRTAAINKFTWEAEGRQLVNLYRAIAQHAPRGIHEVGKPEGEDGTTREQEIG